MIEPECPSRVQAACDKPEEREAHDVDELRHVSIPVIKQYKRAKRAESALAICRTPGLFERSYPVECLGLAGRLRNRTGVFSVCGSALWTLLINPGNSLVGMMLLDTYAVTILETNSKDMS